jgi:hypothetical protein
VTHSGIDDWIYWQLLLQSIVFTNNSKNSGSIFSRIVFPGLPETSWRLIYDCTDWRLQCEWIPLYEWTSYIVSRRTRRKHIRYCWEVFSARCVTTNTARTTEDTAPLLLTYVCWNVFTELLPSNRSMRHNRVYWVQKQGRIELQGKNFLTRNLNSKNRKWSYMRNDCNYIVMRNVWLEEGHRKEHYNLN